MPLPSQSSRPQSRTTHMYRRRKPRRALTALVLCALLGLTVVVWMWKRSDTPQQSSAETTAVVEPDAEADEPIRNVPRQQQRTASPAQPAAEEPQRITMGQPVRLPSPSAPRSADIEAPLLSSSPSPASSSTRETETRTSRESASARSSEPPVREPKQSEPEPEPQSQPQSQPSRDRAVETQTPTVPAAPSDRRVADRLRTGMDLLASNKPIEARRVLTQALLTPGIDRRTAQQIRETLTELNERLVFGREIVPGDPFTFGYAIRPGDTLARIASRQNTHVDWRFIQRINGIARPEAIRAGQQIKLVQGPFHAVVVKQDYRLDLFLGQGSDRVYVRSFPVGLGEHDSTPVGRFRVRPNSKLINPAWTNPRTGKHYTANDPDNPIGDRWIGLEGVSEAIRDLTGYGIHGTIEPESIGRQDSMGCIRLHNDDVELLYEMLAERESTVAIVER